MIVAVFVLLSIYNLVYWPAKFWGYAAGFYTEVKANFYTFCFLEMLAVLSLLVDVIVRWDKFSSQGKKIRLLLTVLLFGAFLLRFAFGFMEHYFKGEVQ